MTHPPELITGLPPADLAASAAATPFLEVWYATVGLLVPRKLFQSILPSGRLGMRAQWSNLLA
jgi:hypothetical protein